MLKLVLGCCMIAAGFFAGCESDGGRVRQGIHDPFDRHPQRSWKIWPFRDSQESKPKPPRPPEDDSALPEYQPTDVVELG